MGPGYKTKKEICSGKKMIKNKRTKTRQSEIKLLCVVIIMSKLSINSLYYFPIYSPFIPSKQHRLLSKFQQCSKNKTPSLFTPINNYSYPT